MNEYADVCEYLFPLFYLSLSLYWFSCFEYVMCMLSTLNYKIVFLHIFINAVLLPMAVPKSCCRKEIVESTRGYISGYRHMVMKKCFSLHDLLLLL